MGGDVHARHVVGQQQVALGGVEVERREVAQVLQVLLDLGLDAADVAHRVVADRDDLGLDHLQPDLAVGDLLLGDLDPGQHAAMEQHPRHAVADVADRPDRNGLAGQVVIGVADVAGLQDLGADGFDRGQLERQRRAAQRAGG